MARGDGSGDGQSRDADALLDPERASPKAKSPKHSASASTREVGTSQMLEAECTACRLPALTCSVWHEHVSGQSYLQAISSMAHSWASRRFLSGW